MQLETESRVRDGRKRFFVRVMSNHYHLYFSISTHRAPYIEFISCKSWVNIGVWMLTLISLNYQLSWHGVYIPSGKSGWYQFSWLYSPLWVNIGWAVHKNCTLTSNTSRWEVSVYSPCGIPWGGWIVSRAIQVTRLSIYRYILRDYGLYPTENLRRACGIWSECPRFLRGICDNYSLRLR